MRKIFIGMAIALLFAGTASAQQLTSNLSLSADVSPICTVTTSPVVWTGYTGAATVNSTTGDVTTQCSADVIVDVGLDAGLNFGLGADGSKRALSDGNGNYLSYVLINTYSPANEWGDQGIGDTYPTPTYQYYSNGDPWVFGIDGDLLSDLSAVPGSYSDTITVIVQF